MADLHIKELEEKVAHYEAIMSKCPQCKASLPASNAEPITASPRNTRSSHSAQQSAAQLPPLALTGSSKRRAPASTLSSSATSSKQLRSASRTVPQASPSIPPLISSDRSHQTSEAPVPSLQHPSKNSSDHPTTDRIPSSSADSSGQPNASSQIQPARPSSLAPSTSDGRPHHGGTLIHLELQQQYNNPRSRTRSGRPSGESPRHAEWMRTADIMLEEIPSGRLWRESLRKMDSSVIAAVALGVAPILTGDVSPTEDVERKDLLRLVRRFAERHSEGCVNFEHFILVCLCRVMSSQGVPQPKIVETLQICISDTSKQNIDRYLKGATWANSMMNELFLTDWGYRAVDLIAIWNRSVATYGTMAAALDSRQYFLTDLTQRKYFEGYQEVPDRRHDTIPWIVKKELGDEVSYVVNPMEEKAVHTYRLSYRDVCEALGYSEEYFMKTEDLHSSNPSSPDLNAGDSDHVGSTPRSDTFHTARQSTTSASSLQRPTSVDETPSNYPFSASYLEKMSLRRKEHHQDDSLDDVAGEDPPSSQSVASQTTKRLVPDRFAKPLGDPDVGRRRRKPSGTPSFAETPSTSMGESAKRPLPESPTSAFQPTTSSRRRHHVEESSRREETGSPSRPERKGSKDQRGRA